MTQDGKCPGNELSSITYHAMFTLEPNGTVLDGLDPNLVRIGLAFTLELFEPFHLETLSVLYWLR